MHLEMQLKIKAILGALSYKKDATESYIQGQTVREIGA